MLTDYCQHYYYCYFFKNSSHAYIDLCHHPHFIYPGCYSGIMRVLYVPCKSHSIFFPSNSLEMENKQTNKIQWEGMNQITLGLSHVLGGIPAINSLETHYSLTRKRLHCSMLLEYSVQSISPRCDSWSV